MIISEIKAEHQILKVLNVKLEQDLNMVITQLQKSGKNNASDSNEDARKAETTKQLRKPKIIVASKI